MENDNWVFGVVANIVHSHTDEDGNVYYGTKAFKPHTKVYIHGKGRYFDNGQVSVIGRNRFGRTVFETVPISLIENVRTKRIFKPSILNLIYEWHFTEGLEWWGRTAEDRKDTEEVAKILDELSKEDS